MAIWETQQKQTSNPLLPFSYRFGSKIEGKNTQGEKAFAN
jgi:hypothetical protein